MCVYASKIRFNRIQISMYPLNVQGENQQIKRRMLSMSQIKSNGIGLQLKIELCK